MDLTTNSNVISDALKYVNGKAEKLGQLVKAESGSGKDSAFEAITAEETTTNDVF